MARKLTWDGVYQDFRQRYPNLRKHVITYRPYDVMMIIIWFDDEISMVYDYRTKTCKVVPYNIEWLRKPPQPKFIEDAKEEE